MPFRAAISGEKLKMLLIKDISHIVLRRTNPAWSMSNIRHEEWCVLVCCFSGNAVYRFDGKVLRVRPGDVLFFPPAMERSVRSDPAYPWSYGSVVFSLHEDRGLSATELAALLAPNPIRASKEISTIFSELALLWAGRSPGHELRCAGLLADLVGRMVGESKERENSSRIPNYSRIKKAICLLERDGRDAPIGRVAAEVGLSESRFRHLFREATGLSPTRYANTKKMQRARDLLVSGEYNVTEAAAELGFQNIFYFSRLFKSVTGQTPSAFLKK